MAEEFEEFDVIFTGNNNVEDVDYCTKFADSDSEELHRAKRKKTENKEMKLKPKAVNIPANNCSWFHVNLFEYEDEEDENEEMVPPHVIVSRRLTEKMAFSVCYGIGRTLKGRDLSEMRNSVLRMTGFLET